MHALARVRARPVKDLLIRAFLAHYSIDLAEAEHADPAAYESFNAFFTRALRPGARQVDPGADVIVSPVDGTVSQCGAIEKDLLFQAKGIHYSTVALLGGDEALGHQFEGGCFATLYLAPSNYHRIHMPLAGTLASASHVPGDLFSVNAATAASVPGLFARNERIACVFDTAAGPMAVVLVGALFVGSMSLSWAGEITATPARGVRRLAVSDPLLALDKGAELGRFNMGSTVIVMFARDRAGLAASLAPGSAVRMGEPLATLRR
jgi:phosphatidylserine decarboxylase